MRRAGGSKDGELFGCEWEHVKIDAVQDDPDEPEGDVQPQVGCEADTDNAAVKAKDTTAPDDDACCDGTGDATIPTDVQWPEYPAMPCGEPVEGCGCDYSEDVGLPETMSIDSLRVLWHRIGDAAAALRLVEFLHDHCDGHLWTLIDAMADDRYERFTAGLDCDGGTVDTSSDAPETDVADDPETAEQASHDTTLSPTDTPSEMDRLREAMRMVADAGIDLHSDDTGHGAGAVGAFEATLWDSVGSSATW